MKKVEKGEFGYLAYKKSRNMIKTIIAFAIVLVIFIIGFIIWKSKNNYLTMLAVVLVLPAAKFAVSYFVLIPHKNCDEELKNAIEKCKGELNSVYDLVVSNKQKPVGIMAAVISDNQILAYTSSAKADKNLFETSVKEFLKNEKLTCSVLLYKDKDTYLGKIKNAALNISLLRKLRKIPSVKKVFIRSGIRFDYCMEDSDDTFLKELCENHISGQLRVAPEHISDKVLSRMGKPSRAVYDSFIKRYKRINDKTGKEQFVVPYLMSSHPGSTMKEAIELAEYVRDLGYMPEQVQDFYPTPSTLSTCMYYTGYDPRTMEKVYTPVSHHEKEMQRALIQYKKPENYDLVKEALLANNRSDLIGFGPKCLIPPRKIRSRNNEKSRKR